MSELDIAVIVVWTIIGAAWGAVCALLLLVLNHLAKIRELLTEQLRALRQ